MWFILAKMLQNKIGDLNLSTDQVKPHNHLNSIPHPFQSVNRFMDIESQLQSESVPQYFIDDGFDYRNNVYRFQNQSVERFISVTSRILSYDPTDFVCEISYGQESIGIVIVVYQQLVQFYKLTIRDGMLGILCSDIRLQEIDLKQTNFEQSFEQMLQHNGNKHTIRFMFFDQETAWRAAAILPKEFQLIIPEQTIDLK